MSYSTIQPNEDLVTSFGVLRREEPEVQRAVIASRRINWHETSIGFANIEINIRDCRAIDGIF